MRFWKGSAAPRLSGTGVGTRRKGREAALQILYQVELSGDRSPEALRDAWGTVAEVSEDVRRRAEQLATTVLDNLETIDGMIADASENWQKDRLSRVDLSVLRLAVGELLFSPDLPVGVVVNEAIEIARRYSDEKSSAFVNGILDRIAENLGREK